MDDLSVGLSVCPVHCEKNGGSDPDAVWHHRSDGSRHEAGSGVLGSAHRKGYFLGDEFGPHGDKGVWVSSRLTEQQTLCRIGYNI